MKYSDIGRTTEIIGSLGKPLGTLIRIQGRITRGGKSKADMDSIFCHVVRADNKELYQTVVIPVHIFSWLSIPEPQEGEIVTYLGYETGSMTGIPEKAFSHMPYVAATDYMFSVYFQVIKKI